MKNTCIVFFTACLLLVGCVPMKKYNDVKDKARLCEEELNALKDKAINFETKSNELDAMLQVLQKEATQLKLDTIFTIPANQDFLLPAQLEFQMSDLVKNSMELLLNKPVKLNITGNVTVSKGIFTKTVPIAYETTQKLNLGAALSGMK